MSYSTYYVYILSNKYHTVFYTGFTDDITRRIWEHKNRIHKGFTSKYNCHKLLYYEEFNNKEDALHREKQIKRYKRDWKFNLIKSINSDWKDLYSDLI